MVMELSQQALTCMGFSNRSEMIIETDEFGAEELPLKTGVVFVDTKVVITEFFKTTQPSRRQLALFKFNVIELGELFMIYSLLRTRSSNFT